MEIICEHKLALLINFEQVLGTQSDDYKIKVGLVRDLNPGPLAPKARIIPLDQRAMPFKARPLGLGNEKRKQTYIYLGNPTEPRRGGRVVKALDC